MSRGKHACLTEFAVKPVRVNDPLNQIVYLKTMHYSKGTVPTTWPLESPSCEVERQTFETRSRVKFSQDNNVAPT